MNLLDSLQIPTNKLDVFIRSVRIHAYLPGRVRLYSKRLIGNAPLARRVGEYLGSFREIDKVETSITTGSILIRYKPEILRQNPQLRKVEEYIMTHVRRK